MVMAMKVTKNLVEVFSLGMGFADSAFYAYKGSFDGMICFLETRDVNLSAPRRFFSLGLLGSWFLASGHTPQTLNTSPTYTVYSLLRFR